MQDIGNIAIFGVRLEERVNIIIRRTKLINICAIIVLGEMTLGERWVGTYNVAVRYKLYKED